MTRAMHLQTVKNKAERKARAERLWRKELTRTQALARSGQIAAMTSGVSAVGMTKIAGYYFGGSVHDA